MPWLAKRGWTLPAFLARGGTKWQASDEVGCRELSSPEPSRPVPRSEGRPQKPAWPRIVELVRALAAEHPDRKKRILAEDAWKLASQEFDESELPSVSTIERHMVDILGGSG